MLAPNRNPRALRHALSEDKYQTMRIEGQGSQYSQLQEMGRSMAAMARKLRVWFLANELAIRRKTSKERQ
jgi:hypothetical protein